MGGLRSHTTDIYTHVLTLETDLPDLLTLYLPSAYANGFDLFYVSSIESLGVPLH